LPDLQPDRPPLTVELAVPYIAVVTLDRPPVNALSRTLREKFVETIETLNDRQDVRAIVLTATGRIFCAGADIKEKQALGSGPGDHARAGRLTRDGFFCLLESRKPVIAAVRGAALGAGFVLAACCDMIFASEDAAFAMPEIDVGQGGGASFLQRILPAGRMRRMLLTGERVPAAELYRLGAIEACLPDGEVMPAALAVAARIAEKSPAAVHAIRSSFGPVAELSLRDGFRLEQDYTNELSRSPDAAEARRAFFEKRKPVF